MSEAVIVILCLFQLFVTLLWFWIARLVFKNFNLNALNVIQAVVLEQNTNLRNEINKTEAARINMTKQRDRMIQAKIVQDKAWEEAQSSYIVISDILKGTDLRTKEHLSKLDSYFEMKRD